MIELPDDEIHVWFVRPDELPGRLARYETLLSQDERMRLGRFVVDHARREFLVGRACLRVVLAEYVGEAPERLLLSAPAHRKPELASSGAPARVRFNLSHTQGLIACAIAGGREVGIDVERADRAVDALELAERFFAPSEITTLRALPAEGLLRGFFECWTLKEAYVKARGLGLALPFERFWFSADAPPRIVFAAGFDDDPVAWHFFRLQPGGQHLGAVAVGRAAVAAAAPAPTLVVHDAGALLAART
jgi:4'-phosphopantetheinyl transferase